jgi:hypothetical protein
LLRLKPPSPEQPAADGRRWRSSGAKAPASNAALLNSPTSTSGQQAEDHAAGLGSSLDNLASYLER